MKASLSARNRFLAEVLNDARFRSLVTAALKGGWNFVYAVYHLALAAAFRSAWFLTMGVYYLTVTGMRAGALRLKEDAGDGRAAQRALKRNAALTFLLAFVFAAVVGLSIAEKRNKVRSTVVAVTMATYTFGCVTAAVRNLVRLKKERTLRDILLRNCAAVCALGSLYGLERMLLGTFGDAAERFTLVMEAASGGGFFLIIVLFGVNLHLQSKRRAGVDGGRALRR